MLPFQRGIILFCLAVSLPLAAGRAAAHPLGNDSITHFSVLHILPDRLEVDLLLDMAETPSLHFQAYEIDTDGDGIDSLEEQQAWLEKKAVEFIPFLRASINGDAIPLGLVEEAIDPRTGQKAVSRLILKIPGMAGMPTYRLLIRYRGAYPQPLDDGEHVLAYEDATYPQYQGLRRILLERTEHADFIGARPSYWDEGIDPFIYEQYDPISLPQENSTELRFRLVAPPARPSVDESAVAHADQETEPTTPAAEPADDSPGFISPGRIGLPPYLESFTDPRNDPARTSLQFRQADQMLALLQGRWGVMMLLSITVLAFGWGAAHALMPGHAKTVVAAYLISQKGTYWHAVMLAIVVTVTHTALVVILGVVIWVYQSTHPALGARLQLWLGLLAGVLVAGMGAVLIWRALTGRLAHHHHEHTHDHHHDNRSWLRKLFTHSHPHLPHAHGPPHAHPHDHHHHGDHKHDHHHHHHGHDHAHAHDHAHHHEHGARAHPHSHPHDHAVSVVPGSTGGTAAAVSCATAPPRVTAEPLSFKVLLLLGIAGGIVPCPTATIIMLLGIGANVVPGALYAVGIFSLGLALTLMAVGFLALSSRRFAARILFDAAHEGELSTRGQWLMLQVVPTISGLAVLALGSAISAHYIHLMIIGRGLFSWMG